MSNTLQVEKRTTSGKGSSRAIRRAGNIPAIIYGGKGGEVSITTPLKELQRAYLQGGFESKIFELELGKEKIKTIPRAVQLHPVTDLALHADFMRVEDSSIVNVFVKVKFLNADKSPGLKRGGVLNVVRREIELLCRADSIPAKLVVDLEGFKIGQSVHAHNIDFPEGCETAITDRDFTIAAIVGRAAESADETEETDEVSEEGEEEASEE